jgi:RNA polymerase sigma factor (sigma-70 family)
MNKDQLSSDIWTAFRRGEQSAFLQLYRQHFQALINYGTKLTGDRDLANDCIIEMLLALWDKNDRLGEVENIQSYLLKCLKNTFLMDKRLQERRLRTETEVHAAAEEKELSYEDYLNQLESNVQVKTKIHDAIKKLTPRQQEILHLKFFIGLSYDEIAKMLQISKRTAYNIVFQSIGQLKKELNQSGLVGFDDVYAFLPVFLALFLDKL